LPSSHPKDGCVTHAPATQRSPVEQAFPSEQMVPSASGSALQPSTVSQPSVVHGFPSSQAAGFGMLVHPPIGLHASVVQAMPSLHGFVGCVQMPSAQRSSVQTMPSSGHDVPESGSLWHPSAGSQVTTTQGFPLLGQVGLDSTAHRALHPSQ